MALVAAGTAVVVTGTAVVGMALVRAGMGAVVTGTVVTGTAAAGITVVTVEAGELAPRLASVLALDCSGSARNGSLLRRLRLRLRLPPVCR